MNIMIATIKSWNIERAYALSKRFPQDVFCIITNKENLTVEKVSLFNPDYIFFPHWSWVIPEEIHEKYNCVLFHMTDLPFGRGGSPLQNLLLRGIYKTKISAIKVDKGIDCGDIYMKESLDISKGNVQQIFDKVSDIVFNQMIPRFLCKSITPIPQVGEVVTFQRRTPAQSEMPKGLTLRQAYDFIRMLAGEGYPNAFIQTDYGRIIFTNAEMDDEHVTATAEIRDKL